MRLLLGFTLFSLDRLRCWSLSIFFCFCPLSFVFNWLSWFFFFLISSRLRFACEILRCNIIILQVLLWRLYHILFLCLLFFICNLTLWLFINIERMYVTGFSEKMSRVYVGNLDSRVTERDLEDEFRVFGVIRRYN